MVDALPVNVTYNNDAEPSVSPQPVFSQGALTWNGDVGFYQRVVISFSVDVDEGFKGEISNTATITHPDIPAPVNATATALVTDDPVFTIVKTSTPEKPGQGKPLTYALEVTNIGQPVDQPGACSKGCGAGEYQRAERRPGWEGDLERGGSELDSLGQPGDWGQQRIGSMRRVFGLVISLFIMTVWCSTAWPIQQEPVRIGVTSVFLDDQTSSIKSWRAYLERKLERPVVFSQRGSYREILDLLLQGKLDFAWVCGYPYVRYEKELRITAVPIYQGKPLYRAYLIVPSDDTATQSLTDLRSKVLVYSDADSIRLFGGAVSITAERDSGNNDVIYFNLPEERVWIDLYLAHGFVEAYRHLYPERIQYTWWTYRLNARARGVGWRLDYFLVSESLRPMVEDVIIHEEVMGSDYCPVTLVLTT